MSKKQQKHTHTHKNTISDSLSFVPIHQLAQQNQHPCWKPFPWNPYGETLAGFVADVCTYLRLVNGALCLGRFINSDEWLVFAWVDGFPIENQLSLFTGPGFCRYSNRPSLRNTPGALLKKFPNLFKTNEQI